MWKIIVGIIIALAIIKVAQILFVISVETIKLVIWKIKLNNRWNGNEKSSLREAFEMECSKEMIRTDNYAKQLDKAIRKIDKENDKIVRKQRKINERFSKMKWR